MLLRIGAFLFGAFQLEQIYQNIEQWVGWSEWVSFFTVLDWQHSIGVGDERGIRF